MPTIAPYGSWKSPITAESIVADSVGLGQIELESDDIYWVEMRPQEGARNVVVRRGADGVVTDVTPAPFNVRTRVHEYGGRSFAVSDGVIYFTNFVDQRLYRQEPGGEPTPLTPAVELRYADGVVDRRRNRMVCVREDHTVEGQEAVNTLVSIDLENGGEGDVLVSGADFYSSPALSSGGSTLAWMAWNHPNMPWDGVELWTARIADDGSLEDVSMVAGGPTESIFQPEWSPDGVLYFVSDRSGWWNLYRLIDGETQPVAPMDAEFGTPQWALGQETYSFESATRIVCEINRRGVWSLASIDTETLELTNIDWPYTEVGRGDIKASPDQFVFEASSATEPGAIVRLRPDSGAMEVLKRSEEVGVDDGYLSVPETIEFPTDDGLMAHAFYYPARNSDFEGPTGERPPLLVVSHGGPTGAAMSSFNLAYQFWTSRGIAVVDVNYGGSTGYGTEYRRRLNGRWGIVDIADCVNAAQHLVDRGDVDGERLIIRGGSAGGYTTLASLTFRDVFKVGASYYGVADLEALAKETHKFESRYMDSMVGPYPECRDLYVERSPIHHTELLSCPIILLQGLEDKIVLPNQAEMMVDALKKKGLPVAYLPFEGEQHGFRKAENVIRALNSELYFYSRILGFDLADDIEPVHIENL
ncbi:MAG: S9 family peptidase [SAR202 cluster bacterium]|jgi:dipeptidyl aminopeptidase/acylaminoacyl peptidase|nr:S9 family peptidase [SAR202 cluster bacterium]MDP7102153.1 S9 family peptidase [SAR202 cluster bacterium]|tara:strand:+ start:4859 stop:6790 length:1932 start_codon:yes stop_codon:yes gene_type:complete